jgi:hypothetical protein
VHELAIYGEFAPQEAGLSRRPVTIGRMRRASVVDMIWWCASLLILSAACWIGLR